MTRCEYSVGIRFIGKEVTSFEFVWDLSYLEFLFPEVDMDSQPDSRTTHTIGKEIQGCWGLRGGRAYQTAGSKRSPDDQGNGLLLGHGKLQPAPRGHTDHLGLHVVMAGGAVLSRNDKVVPTLKSKQRFVAHLVAGAGTLRKRGNLVFVCNALDIVTPFYAGLVYLVAAHFDKMCIFKPPTSPGGSDSKQFLVFSSLKGNDAGPTLFRHLLAVNDRLIELSLSPFSQGSDVLSLVPSSVIMESSFKTYLKASNHQIGRRLAAELRQRLGARATERQEKGQSHEHNGDRIGRVSPFAIAKIFFLIPRFFLNSSHSSPPLGNDFPCIA